MRLLGTYGAGGGVGTGTGAGVGWGVGGGVGVGTSDAGCRGHAVKRHAPIAAAVRTVTVRTVKPTFLRMRVP